MRCVVRNYPGVFGRRLFFPLLGVLDGFWHPVGKGAVELQQRPGNSLYFSRKGADPAYLLLDRGEREIKASDIGAMVMEELKRLDDIAYVRFASVYRSFADIESFESALKELK
jgi:transcriptional repressor NrdR